MRDMLDGYHHDERELAAARRLGLIKTPLGLIKTPQSADTNSVLNQLNDRLCEIRKLLAQTRSMLLEIDHNVFGGTASPDNECAEQPEYPSAKLPMLTRQARDAFDDAQAIHDAVMALTKAL